MQPNGIKLKLLNKAVGLNPKCTLCFANIFQLRRTLVWYY